MGGNEKTPRRAWCAFITSTARCTLRPPLELRPRGQGNNALEALDSRIPVSAKELHTNVLVSLFLLVIFAVVSAVNHLDLTRTGTSSH